MFRRFRSNLGHRHLFPSPVMISIQTQFRRFTATVDNSTTPKISSKQANNEQQNGCAILDFNNNSNNYSNSAPPESIPPLNYKLFARDIDNIMKMAFMLNGDEELPALVWRDEPKNKKEVPSKISEKAQNLVQEIGEKLAVALFGSDLPSGGCDDDAPISQETKAFRYSAMFAAVAYDLSFLPKAATFVGVDVRIKEILEAAWNPRWTAKLFALLLPMDQLTAMINDKDPKDANFVGVDVRRKEILGAAWNPDWGQDIDNCFPKRQLAVMINDQTPPPFDDNQKTIYSAQFRFVQSVLEKTSMWRRAAILEIRPKFFDVNAGFPCSSSSADLDADDYSQLAMEINPLDNFRFPPIPAAMKAAHQALADIVDKHNEINPQTNNQPQKDLQIRLNNFFVGAVLFTIASPLVVQNNNQPAKTLYDHHYTHSHLAPDLAVYKNGQTHVMGRIAIVELKPVKELDDENVVQLRKSLSRLLRQNPFRKVAYGMLTNGKAFQLFKFSAVKDKHHLQMERIAKNDVPATATSPTAADCLIWLLSQSAEELGFVDWPKFKLDGKDHTLGRILGFGESCAAYPAVPVDERIKGNGLQSSDTDKESAVVLKVYHSSLCAARELKILQAIPASLQNTTKVLNPQPVGLPPNTIAVTPFAKPFRARGDVRNKNNNREITTAHVGQLIEALTQLHEAGILHRDIQPKNIFCSRKSPYDALLNDFGRSELRSDNTFCEYRILAEHDWKMMAVAVSQLRGGADAWKAVLARKYFSQEKQLNDEFFF